MLVLSIKEGLVGVLLLESIFITLYYKDQLVKLMPVLSIKEGLIKVLFLKFIFIAPYYKD